MDIHLISVGQKMPKWVDQGYQEYARRLTGQVKLKLNEIPMPTRHKGSSVDKLIVEEGQKIIQACPANAIRIVLDERGKNWSTTQLSQQMDEWLHSGQSVALLVGGPDGHSQEVKQSANQLWSLSNLVFPHPLVRILLAEQIYRAWSLLQGHPYHRA
ncbi:MAG: 23S rRNA (pseudouridine(1915)-N(3))-methyltransferase RlmH [bacterium]